MWRLRNVAIVSGVALGVAIAWVVTRPAMRPHTDRPNSGPAVLYARAMADRVEIMWELLGSGKARTVYRSATSRFVRRIPDEIGFLPSPDGRWMVLWETERDDETGLPVRAQWLVARLPDGKLYRLGETRRDANLLPAWEAGPVLVIMGRTGDFRWDPSTGRPRGRLPGPPANARLREYCQRYYPLGTADLPDAWANVFTPSDTPYYKRQPIEHVLLRSTGIPGMGELRVLGRQVYGFPYAAYSPDGSQFAFAHRGESTALSAADLNLRRPEGARIQIRRIPSRELLWLMDVPAVYRPSRETPWVRYNPPVEGPWTYSAVRDPRWSHDGSYFSFTVEQETETRVVVLDASDWWEVATIPNAMNAFVLPDATEARTSADAP